MTVENDKRLSEPGPRDPETMFPTWFKDANGTALELVTDADPRAPARGELEQPASPVKFPDNFPDEAFYFYAEARLQVGGAGVVGRARVIMALEAAFVGDGTPRKGRGVVFSRLRVRIDDVIPGAEYVVRHPYGETKVLTADERGRVAYTCDLGIAEENPERVRDTGEIAPFLVWASGAPAGYIGDGVTPHPVVNGPFGNRVVIKGPRIDEGSADRSDPGEVTTDLFVVQGRIAGAPPVAPPQLGGANSVLEILEAEYRTSRAQYRVRGRITPVSIADGAGFKSDHVTVTLNDQEIGIAFPDITGAWDIRKTSVGPTVTAPPPRARIVATSGSGKRVETTLIIRN